MNTLGDEKPKECRRMLIKPFNSYSSRCKEHNSPEYVSDYRLFN